MPPSESGAGDAGLRAHWRTKAAHCFELAERPENRPQAKILIKLAQRFMERARARPD